VREVQKLLLSHGSVTNKIFESLMEREMKESERGFACLLTWGSSVEGVASAERNWFLRLEVGKQGRKQHLIIN